MNLFWGNFSRNFFCPVHYGGSRLGKISKKLQNSRSPKSGHKRSLHCLNMFWTCIEQIIFEFLFDQCTKEGCDCEKFRENRKHFKKPKMPKNDPKSVQTCVEHDLRWFLQKKDFFCLVHYGGSRLEKNSKKFPNFRTPKNGHKRSQNCLNMFGTCFEVIFPVNFIAQCTMEGRD